MTKVIKFMGDTGVGSPIAIKHRIKVKSRINPSYRDDDSLPPYQITCEFEIVQLPYRGKVFEQVLPKHIFVCDEDGKNYVEGLQGKSIAVEGVLTKCDFRTHNVFNKKKPVYITRLELTQMAFSPPLQK